jgi:hypothetical protein
MQFSEHDHMIEALSANASDESFREWIWPRTLRRCEHLLNAHSMNPSSEMAAVKLRHGPVSDIEAQHLLGTLR